MLQPPPAEPGMREEEVDTPALLLDLDAFEHNLDLMARLLEPTGTKLRAHAKTHKSAVVALRQMTRGGAIGQCTQKVAEAEALAWGGVPDILVSNQVVGARKLARLCALARIAKVAAHAVIEDTGEASVGDPRHACGTRRILSRLLRRDPKPSSRRVCGPSQRSNA